MSEERRLHVCCMLDCDADAAFFIYGDSHHPDDWTESCEAHIGLLLGTPDFLIRQGRENRGWSVVTIEAA